MSPAEFAVVITMLCGKGDTDKHWDCYDYYNNCVINKSVQITVGNIEKCKSDFQKGIVKLENLKESTK